MKNQTLLPLLRPARKHRARICCRWVLAAAFSLIMHGQTPSDQMNAELASGDVDLKIGCDDEGAIALYKDSS